MGFENRIEQKEHPSCPVCKGTGKVQDADGKKVLCRNCGGKGKIY